VVLARDDATGDAPANALVASLRNLGVHVTYLGREGSAERIARVVTEQRADALELCLAPSGGVPLLRELLRELAKAGRRGVSIVVHKHD
jgi:methylmalonyl-CoA mutase cobalamin-binding subunit